MMTDDSSSYSDRIRRANPGRVAQLLSLGVLTPDELRAILLHELTKPVQFDLSALPSAQVTSVRNQAEAEHLVLKSLSDLLLHPHPPLRLLAAVKKFAKSHQINPGHLPPNVSSLIYYAAIATALI